MRRMRHVHVDMPHLTVGFMDDQDLLGRLNEINQLYAPKDVKVQERLAGQHLSLAAKGDAAGEHAVIDLFQPLDDPRLQIGIAEIRDAVSRLALAIGNIGMILGRPLPDLAR